MPTPVPKWYKWLIKLTDWALAAGAASLYDQISVEPATNGAVWRYAVMRYARSTPAGTVEDHAQWGLNIVNITGGNIDTSWTTTDYTTCETHLTEYFNALKPFQSSSHTLVDIRWYAKQFHPDMPIGESIYEPGSKVLRDVDRFARMGPPQRVTTVNIAGTDAAKPLPYQMSMSITLKTPGPKHWGRIYLPGMGISNLSTANGRWDQSIAKGCADRTAELLDDLAGSEFQVAIPATQHEAAFSPALNAVTAVQVDDIPDVIRRRRSRQPAARAAGVPTP